MVEAGSIPGHRRKLVVLACYLPPNLTKKTGTGALDFIEDLVIEMKRRYKDPNLIVTGDFNQWDVSLPLSEFRDFSEAPVGSTRNLRCIDRIWYTCAA